MISDTSMQIFVAKSVIFLLSEYSNDGAVTSVIRRLKFALVEKGKYAGFKFKQMGPTLHESKTSTEGMSAPRVYLIKADYLVAALCTWFCDSPIVIA